MTPPDGELTFFSTSYHGDLKRFGLLRRSIRRFAPRRISHIVAVPSRDMAAFKAVAREEPEVSVVAQEDYVADPYYPRLAYRAIALFWPSQAWRFKRFAGASGWHIQQIVKLSMPAMVKSGAVAILDSDIFFTRPFELDELGLGRQLLLRDEPTSESGRHRQYMAEARRILGLPAGSTDHHYMAYPAIWYPAWVRQLQQHIEKVHGEQWQQVLFRVSALSEYSIYGVFVEDVLRPPGLEVQVQPFHVGVWDANSFTDFLDGRLAPGGQRRPLTLVVQSNLGISVKEYYSAAERYLTEV